MTNKKERREQVLTIIEGSRVKTSGFLFLFFVLKQYQKMWTEIYKS